MYTDIEKYFLVEFDTDILTNERNELTLLHRYSDLLNCISDKYNNSESEILSIKEDMHIKVIVLNLCILRIIPTDLYNERFSNFYKYAQDMGHPNLEHIYEIYKTKDYIFIVTKKIKPLIKFCEAICEIVLDTTHKLNLEKLKINMTSILAKINSDGYNHNDCTLDNIGYDESTDSYVLFDFDKISCSKKRSCEGSIINRDQCIFLNSLKFWLNI